LFINDKIKKDFLSYKENLFIFLKRPFSPEFYTSSTKKNSRKIDIDLFCKRNFIDLKIANKIFEEERNCFNDFTEFLQESLARSRAGMN
jgi:hypothetical protein